MGNRSFQVGQSGKVLSFGFIKIASGAFCTWNKRRVVQHGGLSFTVEWDFESNLNEGKREKGRKRRDYPKYSCGTNSHMSERRLSFGEKQLLASYCDQNISRAFPFYFSLKIRLKRSWRNWNCFSWSNRAQKMTPQNIQIHERSFYRFWWPAVF